MTLRVPKQIKEYIIPILILFFIANLSILIGGLEIWFGWNFIAIIALFIATAKFVFIVAITAGLLEISNLNDHPLVLTGLVFSAIVVFSNSYYENYQFALYQKVKYGGAVTINASELHLHNKLYKTPYIKISNSGLSEIKTFKEYLRPELTTYNEYCYADIINTQEPTLIINQCRHESLKDIISIQDQKANNEIIALALPKKYNKLHFINTQQFFVAPKTFEDFYLKQEKAFFRFVKIINSIGVAFSLIFIVFKKYI